MKTSHLIASLALSILGSITSGSAKEPIDYVNPYIGNISHLLVPTFATVQLPNSMLRVYPERSDYTSDRVNGLPIVVTTHREKSAFKLLPQLSNDPNTSISYNYDNEHLTPYGFDIELDDNNILATYAVNHQSAIYKIDFRQGAPSIVLSTQNGIIEAGDQWLSGWQLVSDQTKVYIYIESQESPSKITKLNDQAQAFCYAASTKTVHLRYGISYISVEQAKKNLRREINHYDVARLAKDGRAEWNRTLSRIKVSSTDENELTIFYSSYYRTFERPICMSEDGLYWSAFDNQVHHDGGTPFYNDDWIWDTYRAHHPLRTLTDHQVEEDIIKSYLLMAEQMGTGWMPTFPEVNGDSRRMNSNHGVAMIADALSKGMNMDACKAFEACRKAIEEKTLAPWSGNKAGWIDEFFLKNGYIPALQEGEVENDPNVNLFEKRQPVAVTLGTSYDYWCLSIIAHYLSSHANKKKEAKEYADMATRYSKMGYSYRNLWNPKTCFFHPKDSKGNFIEPFDYRYSGGQGARNYYGENNGWTYRFDVPHNVADLISLMGGPEMFVKALDDSFSEPLGKSKFEFYSQLPDHTGNVGQFSMANEPSFHIPYLYNYAGVPWKTQRCIRKLLRTWYRNDLMGIPGDEDGGGMTSFVVFSMLGFYPVTPGLPVYNIGSPVFPSARIQLSNGKVFEIEAQGVSPDNKYIQRAELNGKVWDKPWFSHSDIINGGKLVLVMGSTPNKKWGTDEIPPSAN
ncbi:MAG: GH92 family glycosyl hydrolase [Prevotella sp.]|nr:GH92 family glycosyl hydrolase [Prevotella sp.]